MRGFDCKHDRLSVQKQESGPVVRIRITLPYGLAGFTECIMDVAAVAYYSLVELSHKKRGGNVAASPTLTTIWRTPAFLNAL